MGLLEFVRISGQFDLRDNRAFHFRGFERKVSVLPSPFRKQLAAPHLHGAVSPVPLPIAGAFPSRLCSLWLPLMPVLQYTLGLVLLVVGFALAFWITFQMGWRNAFGEKHGLKTQGWFRISRNPVYVATWVGMIGWGLLANTLLVWILLALWATMYLLAPVFEEPWLEQQYGQDYLDYKRQTRRFL